MSGEATVGSIIGYLRLDRSDWDTELDAAGRKADELSAHDPNIRITTNAPSAIAQLAVVAAAVKRLQDAQGAENVAQAKLSDLQAKGDATAGQLAAAEERLEKAHRATAAATIQLAAAHDVNDTAMRRATQDADRLTNSTTRLGQESKKAEPFAINLWGALAAVSPAAIPIAGVVGGALVGLLPVIGAVTLGVKGISNEMASGQLAGTKYGMDISSVKTELAKLESISAGGMLSGLDRGLASSQGLFPVVNKDIGQMSTQIGNIIAKGGPALLSLLTALNPLFTTFGDLITRGATELDHYATNSTGVQHFVSYVQAELPSVMAFLGETVQLFSHLAQGAAPFGGVLLNDLTLFVRVLDAIPVGVLREAVPLAVSLYAAFKTYQGLSTVFTKVNSAIDAVKAKLGSANAAITGYGLRQDEASAQVVAAKSREAAGVAQANLDEVESQRATAVEINASLSGVESAYAESSASIIDSLDAQIVELRAVAVAAQKTADDTAAAATTASQAVTDAGATASIGWDEIAGPLAALTVGLGILFTAFGDNTSAAQKAAQAQNSYAQSLEDSTNALSAANLAATAKNLQDDGSIKKLAQLATANKDLGISYGDLSLAVNGSAAQFDAVIGKLSAVAAANAKVTTSTGGALDPYLSGGQQTVTTYNTLGTAANKLAANLKTLRDGFTAQQKAQIQLNAIQAQAQTLADGGASATAAQARALGLTVPAYLAAQEAAAQSTSQTAAQTAQFQADGDAADLLSQALAGLAGNNLNLAQAQTSLGQANLSVLTSFKANGTAIDGNTAKALANQSALQQQATAAATVAEAVGRSTKSSAAEIKSYTDSKDAIEAKLLAQGKLTTQVQKYIDRLYDLSQLKLPPTNVDANTKAGQAKIKALEQLITNIKQNREPGIGVLTQAAEDQIATIQAEINALQGKTVVINVVPTAAAAKALGHRETGSGSAVSTDSASQTLLTGGSTSSSAPPAVTADVSLNVSGINYSSARSAANAVTRALANLSKGATGFGNALLGSESTLASASTTLINDAKAAGATQKQLTQAEKTRTQLLKASNALAAAENKLKTDQQAEATEAANVKSAATGSFNIATDAGTTGAGIQADAAQAANTIKVWAADIRTLQKRGLAPSLIGQLAEGGPSDLPQVLDLLQLGASGLKSVNSSVASIASIGGSLGSAVGQAIYGGVIAKDKAVVVLDTKTVTALGKELAKDLKVALGDVTYKIEWNGQTAARLVATGAAKNAHRG